MFGNPFPSHLKITAAEPDAEMPRVGGKEASGQKQHALRPQQFATEIIAVVGKSDGRESHRAGPGTPPFKKTPLPFEKSVQGLQVARR